VRSPASAACPRPRPSTLRAQRHRYIRLPAPDALGIDEERLFATGLARPRRLVLLLLTVRAGGRWAAPGCSDHSPRSRARIASCSGAGSGVSAILGSSWWGSIDVSRRAPQLTMMASAQDQGDAELRRAEPKQRAADAVQGA